MPPNCGDIHNAKINASPICFPKVEWFLQVNPSPALKPLPFRTGKKASLRVNPCLRRGTLSKPRQIRLGNRRVDFRRAFSYIKISKPG